MGSEALLDKLKTSSLRTTFIAFVGALVVAACVVIAGANVVADQFAITGAAKDRAEQITHTLAEVTGTDLKFREVKRLEGVSSTLRETFDASAIAIWDKEGLPTVSQTNEARSLETLNAALKVSLRTGKPQIIVGSTYITKAVPVLHEGELVGVVAVEVGKNNHFSSTYQSILWNIALSSLVIAFALPAAIFMIGRMTEPLDTLTQFAIRAGSTRVTERVDIKTGNEFETLGDAFNRMLTNMDKSMGHIQKLAFTDSVTDLPNRERFMRAVRASIKRRPPESFVAVISLNVDRFRWVNETLGQKTGDEVLSLIGRRIYKALHTADRSVRITASEQAPSLLARLSADEFAVVVPIVEHREQVMRLVQMIISSMRQPLEIAGQSLTLGISAGVAMGPDHAATAEDLLKCADLAMKAAKKTGRSKSKFYSPKLDRVSQDRLSLEADLRKGIERDEFEPFFQAKVNFETGAITGAEALVRWRRPNGEMISPGIFIPVAEQLGLISFIGESVLSRACLEAHKWMAAGHDCRVAVNVSPLQFEEANLADRVLESLREASLPPGRLELEVTETMAVGDPDRVSEIMRPLRAMGVRLAIDDFGAGHSNLGTLTKLPFDVFKIDQQFVMALHSDKQAPAIVEMILAMAEAMDLETVAEGVETAAQADFLRRRGCTLAQGYLYSKPMPADQFFEFLNEWEPFGGNSSDPNELDLDELLSNFG